MVRIALTKGRIEKSAVKILEKAGYECSSLEEGAKGRKLIFEIGCGDISLVLAKAADVITYVEHGVCDLGIVGEDTIMEFGKSVCELIDLKFGVCSFALAGKKGENFYDGYSHKVIASKYPFVTKNYFAEKGIDVEVVKIEGSVELAPLLGLADAIVDIVETGSTLKANGLEVYEKVADISARLIGNTASIKMKRNEINSIVGNIRRAIDDKDIQ